MWKAKRSASASWSGTEGTVVKKFLGKRMGHGQNISSYINEILEVLDGLIFVGTDLNEELLTTVLRSRLPEQFENFVVAIKTRDELPRLKLSVCIKIKDEHDDNTKAFVEHRTKSLIRRWADE